MSKSLQEQLLALGLSSKQPKKIRKPSRRVSGNASKLHDSASAQGKGPGAGRQSAAHEVPLDRAYALRKQVEKQQADSARQRKQADDRRRRQLNKEIRVIVMKHRLNDAKAEIPRHFMYRGRIRKISLTAGQLQALNAAELGIAYLSGAYHLLAPEHVEAVRKLSAEHIPDLTSDSTENEPENEFPIPDDLTW